MALTRTKNIKMIIAHFIFRSLKVLLLLFGSILITRRKMSITLNGFQHIKKSP
jgi:hypothetical protein